MDKQLENHIRNFIILNNKLKYDNIEDIKILSITKHDNLSCGEMRIIFQRPMEDFLRNNIFSGTITLSHVITTKELNEFISSQRNDKINTIL